MIHEPVLVEEVLHFLNIKKDGVYIDATMNGGGHTTEILKHVGPGGVVIGIERDGDIADRMKQKKIHNLIVEENNYSEMKNIVSRHNIKKIDGVLFDLGLSSWHLEQSGRGFSFAKDEVLDMRFSQKDSLTAAEIINSYPQDTLTDIFSTYGEIRNAKSLSRAIVAQRKQKRIITTNELSEIAARYVRAGKTNPATKLFQALRIAVNQELDAVRVGIAAAMDLVTPGGRVVAISFHSLEDRIVKNLFRSSGHAVTKKPVIATRAEIMKNPRSRSAKLRAWENI